MNDIIKNILTRRSVRTFSDKQISKEDIQTLLEVALYAPSGRGQQTWKFTAIINHEIISSLAEVIGEVLNRDNYDFYKPTALIIASNTKDSRWAKEDNACALQNIFLAAHSMNIGSVWINQLNDICDNDRIRAVLNELNIPENHDVFGIAALGYNKNTPLGKVTKIGETTIIE